jgi:hypothetical protein
VGKGENGQRNEVLNRIPSMSRYKHPRTGHRSRVAWLGSPCASRTVGLQTLQIQKGGIIIKK